MYESFLMMSNEHEEQSKIIELYECGEEYAIEECVGDHYQSFQYFIQSMSDKDPNWKFWIEFLQMNNCFGYIALFYAIQSRNWNLHLASLKIMAPVFSAFNRTTYRKLIPC